MSYMNFSDIQRTLFSNREMKINIKTYSKLLPFCDDEVNPLLAALPVYKMKSNE